MTNQKAPLYPKSHLLAASGVAALLSLALLVFPSREVEAKKSLIDLRLDYATEQAVAPEASEEATAPKFDSPFASIEQSSNEVAEQAASPQEDPRSKKLVAANGDTLSTLFAKAGLPSSTVHSVLASSKDAKQLSRLKVGQVFEFQLTEQGELASLQSRISALETLHLERTDSGYTFKKEEIKPELKAVYAHGEINSSLFVAARQAGLSHNLNQQQPVRCGTSGRPEPQPDDGSGKRIRL